MPKPITPEIIKDYYYYCNNCKITIVSNKKAKFCPLCNNALLEITYEECLKITQIQKQNGTFKNLGTIEINNTINIQNNFINTTNTPNTMQNSIIGKKAPVGCFGIIIYFFIFCIILGYILK